MVIFCCCYLKGNSFNRCSTWWENMSVFPTSLVVPELTPAFIVVAIQVLLTSGTMKSVVCILIFLCIFPVINLIWPFCSVIWRVPQFQWKPEKVFESLHYNTVNHTQLQFVRFTQVLISFVCLNTNHNYVLLIYHSIQRDKQTQYKINTVQLTWILDIIFSSFFFHPCRLLASNFVLWKYLIIANVFSRFAFSNLSPDLLLPAPFYTVTCSSIALAPFSPSRPNVLVASKDRYFSRGHLAQEIHALLHIHCVICTTKTPTTSL